MKHVYKEPRRLADGSWRTYYYFRRKGGPRTRLPDNPDSAAFMAEYEALMCSAPARGRWPSGSAGAVITEYRLSSEYRQLSEASKRDYTRYLEEIREKHGNKPLAGLSRGWVLKWRDSFQDHPRAANYRLSVLKLLLSWAVERGYLPENPARSVKRLRIEQRRADWTDGKIRHFRGVASKEMTDALGLALYTGQRQADVLAMGWRQIRAGEIEVRQTKGDETVWIPCHPKLLTLLDDIPKRSTVILTTPAGIPWKADHFRHKWREAILKAGLDGLHFHDLRHRAAASLAEVGCSEKEIAAITGHKTLAMVQKYTAEADRRRLAKSAVAKLERREDD